MSVYCQYRSVLYFIQYRLPPIYSTIGRLTCMLTIATSRTQDAEHSATLGVLNSINYFNYNPVSLSNTP